MDSVLGQEVQLMVNIAPPTVKDKDLVHECTKIRNSGLPHMQFTQWQFQKTQIITEYYVLRQNEGE
jgi:hypothetical protein